MQEKLIHYIKELFFNVIGIHQTPFLEGFTKTIGNFIYITAELFILFIAISAIIEFVIIHINQQKLQKLFKGRGLIGNIAAAIFGAITPFCACSTIPMAVGFFNAKVPFGPVMSFLISSPLLNPIVLAMLAATVGIMNAILYFILTFILAVFFGYLLEKLGFAKYVKPIRADNKKHQIKDGIDSRRYLPIGNKVTISLRAGWNSLKPILTYLFIGVAIGAAIYGYLPDGNTFARYAGQSSLLAVPIAAIIGIPLYIRAETAIPIAMSLISKGVGMGTAIALIIGGAGMAIPEMTMLAKIFRRKLLITFIFTIFLVAVVSGYIFNVLK
ncbi:MAG: permease [Hyphomicrobiales bacterium]